MAEEHLSSVRCGSSVLCGEVDPYKFDCNNCARLEKQVEKAVDELCSAQLLIDFLQADLNKYAERVKAVVMPPSGLSEIRECSVRNSNGSWKIVNSKHTIKPSNLPKCVPTPVISSNRYSLLDNIQDASSNNKSDDATNGIHHKHPSIDRGAVYPTKVDLQYSAF
jgi:hypothetical protein